LSLLLNKNKKNAVIGVVLGVLTIAFGGFTVEGRAVEKLNWIFITRFMFRRLK